MARRPVAPDFARERPPPPGLISCVRDAWECRLARVAEDDAEFVPCVRVTVVGADQAEVLGPGDRHVATYRFARHRPSSEAVSSVVYDLTLAWTAIRPNRR